MSQSMSNTHRSQMRMASVVVLVTMIGWMAVSWFGGKMGLPVRFAFLADLCALAAFAWAGIVMFRIWRVRQTDRKE